MIKRKTKFSIVFLIAVMICQLVGDTVAIRVGDVTVGHIALISITVKK